MLKLNPSLTMSKEHIALLNINQEEGVQKPRVSVRMGFEPRPNSDRTREKCLTQDLPEQHSNNPQALVNEKVTILLNQTTVQSTTDRKPTREDRESPNQILNSMIQGTTKNTWHIKLFAT